MSPAFAVDSMLGSVARKLRLYGFDVFYDHSIQDDELIQVCALQGRVLLTSDRPLHAKALKKGLQAVLVGGRNDVVRVAEVFSAMGLDPSLLPEKSRCPLCNGPLREASKEDVNGVVPPGVLARYSSFYQCEHCRHTYWEGGHWLRLGLFAEQVRRVMKG
jgi:uncharacterized protein with PIN domain